MLWFAETLGTIMVAWTKWWKQLGALLKCVLLACCCDHLPISAFLTHPRLVLVIQVAERTGKPILYGMRRESDGWSFEEQLAPLRAGDVVTYVYRSTPHNIVVDGTVAPSIVAARERCDPTITFSFPSHFLIVN